MDRETHFALPASVWLSREVGSVISAFIEEVGLVVAETERGMSLPQCNSAAPPRCTNMGHFHTQVPFSKPKKIWFIKLV